MVSVCGEAEDGRAAIDKVKELNPDVVILDWQMPVMDGLRLRATSLASRPKPRWRCCTLHSGPQIAKAEAIGIQYVFSKADRLEHLSDVAHGRM